MGKLPKLVFLGDSHVRAVETAKQRGLLRGFAAEFVHRGGATAVGLRHPTSKTQALKVFRRHLLPAKPDLIPIFQLGEVDCGFVVWVRAQRYGESVEEQVAQSIAAYCGFLREVREAGYEDALVTSAVLPTIGDGELDGEVQHLRREVQQNQVERTALTLRYNAALAAEVARIGLRFHDFTPRLLDPATGVIHRRFRAPDVRDHHLDPVEAAPLWAEAAAVALAPWRARQRA